MRYGKVYFYDRMGNREPTESDKIKDALESFEAPRFRPPEKSNLMKTYKTTPFSPLETPPPISFARLDEPSSYGRLPPRLDSGDSIAFPPRPNGDFNLLPFNNTDKYQMDEPPGVRFDMRSVQIPEDPIPSCIEPPRQYNPVIDAELAERIQPTVDEGIRRGISHRALVDDMGEMDLGDSRQYNYNDTLHTTDHSQESQGMSSVHLRREDEYEGVCEQCRVEEMYMNRLRSEADAAAEKHRLSQQRAAKYEADISSKEEQMRRTEEASRRDLMFHVDKVNDEIVQEHRRRRQKSPPADYYIFRKESDDRLSVEKQKKDEWARALHRQIEEKRERLIEEHEHEEELDAISNQRAAREFADARDIELKQRAHEKERLRKGLEFQMEMQRRGPAAEDNWLWWAERPDEHGWREARMREGGRQVERNETMQNSIHQLEDFKRKQAENDSNARMARSAKYEKIRERLHENSQLIFGSSAPAARERGVILQPDPRVEAAWKAAHELNDKKYRILQENVSQKSISGAALGDSAHSTSCRRCVRCARPLQRNRTFTVSKGEFLMPRK